MSTSDTARPIVLRRLLEHRIGLGFVSLRLGLFGSFDGGS
jgi:hypothetical protein